MTASTKQCTGLLLNHVRVLALYLLQACKAHGAGPRDPALALPGRDAPPAEERSYPYVD